MGDSLGANRLCLGSSDTSVVFSLRTHIPGTNLILQTRDNLLSCLRYHRTLALPYTTHRARHIEYERYSYRSLRLSPSLLRCVLRPVSRLWHVGSLPNASVVEGG